MVRDLVSNAEMDTGQHMPGSIGPQYTHEESVVNDKLSMINDQLFATQCGTHAEQAIHILSAVDLSVTAKQ